MKTAAEKPREPFSMECMSSKFYYHLFINDRQ